MEIRANGKLNYMFSFATFVICVALIICRIRYAVNGSYLKVLQIW